MMITHNAGCGVMMAHNAGVVVMTHNACIVVVIITHTTQCRVYGDVHTIQGVVVTTTQCRVWCVSSSHIQGIGGDHHHNAGCGGDDHHTCRYVVVMITPHSMWW